MPTPTHANPYIGRFAPSPTGLLHLGSLVAALASFLHARTRQGQWLVRMEDLDPPREQAGAASAILQSLEDHGLTWDGTVVYQSQRLPAYRDTLAQLTAAGLIYACDCTRQDLQAMGGIYNGRCRTREVSTHKPHALRLRLYDNPIIHTDVIRFIDLLQGEQTQDLRREAGDPIVKRKDGLFAYQLAVVVDDIAQGISHIIRGMDLLAVSARQMALFQILGATAPAFGHVPLVLNSSGQKLSKQNLAPALNSAHAVNNLWQALSFLGQNPPSDLLRGTPHTMLDWAQAHWDEQDLGSSVKNLSAQTDSSA
jgi:glutamyl-Q tRNA(Asp) synthetase